MWKIQNGKKVMKLGKTFVIVVLSIFCIVGIIVLFSEEHASRMPSFCLLINTIMPFMLPVTCGVAAKGIGDLIGTFWGRKKEGE